MIESAADRTFTATPVSDPSPAEKAIGLAPVELPTVRGDFYRFEAEVGRGGVGVVVRAHDVRLGRRVALKQLQEVEPRARARFEREMRITAKLQHPGVVPIHEAGILESGAPFYAMKLIEGASLKAIIAGCSTLEQRLAQLPVIIQVVETVAYAHNRSVIHRDLKPSNVIVGDYGETVVIDWGLAKDLTEAEVERDPSSPSLADSSQEMTVAGQIVGTPAYMAPEQARGEEAGKSADVYALGGMLRQLVTGQLPFFVRSSAEMLAALRDGPVAKVSLVAPSAPRDLCAVIDKAMEREPAARYVDASALLADLKRFVNGSLVSAYSYAPRERVSKWASRRRSLVVTASVALLMLGIGGVWSGLRIIHERDAAIRSRAETVQQSNALIREQASRELDQNNASRAVTILKRYPQAATDWNAIYPLINRAAMAGLPDFWVDRSGMEKGVFAVADPRSRYLVVGTAHQIEVWNIHTGQLQYRVPVASSDEAVLNNLTSEDIEGVSYVLGALSDGELLLIPLTEHASEPQRIRVCGQVDVKDIAVVPSSDRIVFGCKDGRVGRLDAASKEIVDLDKHPVGSAYVGVLGRDSVISGAGDGILDISSLDSGKRLKSLSIGGRNVILSATSRCDRLAVGTSEGNLLIVSATKLGIEERYAVDPGADLFNVGLDPECRYAYGLSVKYKLAVINLVRHEVELTTQARDVAFFPRGSALVVGTETGDIEYRDLRWGWRQSWRTSGTPVRSVFASPDGAFGALGDELTIFSASRVARLIPLSTAAASIAPSHDESQLLLGGRTGGAGILDLDGSSPLIFTYWHSGLVLTRLGADSNLYSAGWRDGCVVRWDIAHGEPDLVFCIPAGIVDMYVTENGSIYVANYAGAVVKYEPASGQFTVATDLGAIMRIVEDSRTGGVVVSTLDGKIYVLDADIQVASQTTVEAHMGLAFKDPVGRLMALTLDGRDIDVVGGHQLSSSTCSGMVNRSWLSEDHELALMGCRDGRLLVWPAMHGAHPLQHDGVIADVDGTSDGLVAAVSAGGNLSLSSLKEQSFVAMRSASKLINVEILATQNAVVVADESNLLALWSLDQPQHFPLNPHDVYEWLRTLKGI